MQNEDQQVYRPMLASHTPYLFPMDCNQTASQNLPAPILKKFYHQLTGGTSNIEWQMKL